jgi:hypothetical protein
MKRPPERKVVLAAIALAVAASILASRPAAGFADKADLLLIFKVLEQRD